MKKNLNVITICELNTFIKQNYASFSTQASLFVFITGASGAGKTHLVKALETELDPQFTRVEYFDRIGVPPLEEMIKEFGSGEKWQEAMTHLWIKRLVAHQDKKVLILEGQFNPQFAADACKELNINHYLLILIHAAKEVREKRLVEQRLQPELANETMENWAQFLKRKTEELGGKIIDTSHSNLQANLNEIARLIKENL